MFEKKKPGQKIEASTQAYLPISEIKEGIVVMKDTSLRSVVIVSSLNFALKSDQEKDAIIVSFQEFLNSLDFPVQILATSRKLNLDSYLGEISKLSDSQQNPLVKIQTEEYLSFLNELLTYSNIMEKRFFVVVPYYPGGIDISKGVKNPFGKKGAAPQTNFEEGRRLISERIESVIAGLSSVGLRCVALGTEDLLELYYTIYNPDTAKSEKIKGAKDIDVPIVTGTPTNMQEEPGEAKI